MPNFFTLLIQKLFQRKPVEQQFMNIRQRVDIADLVNSAPFSVYGPVGTPLDLVLCNHMHSAIGKRLTTVGFIFTTPRYPQARENFELYSIDTRKPGVSSSLQGTSDNPLHAPAALLFRRYRYSQEDFERAQSMQASHQWKGSLSIDGTSFTGELHYWHPPYSLAQFLLKSDGTLLSGTSACLSENELFDLLRALKHLKNLSPTLVQYQQNMDAERERLFGI